MSLHAECMEPNTESDDMVDVDTHVDRDPLAMWGAVVRSLRYVIPYADLEEIDRFSPICEEAGLDQVDFLRLMDAVEQESGVAIPPADFQSVGTLAGLEDYLNRHQHA